MRPILSILFLLSVNISIAQTRTFPPPSESIKDSSLSSFLKNLKTAVQKKDTSFIYSVLNPNIKFTFSDGNGIENFKKSWKLQKRNSEFWHYIEKPLSMSGYQLNDSQQYMLPYIFPMLDKKFNSDASITVGDAFLTKENVHLKECPSFHAKTLLKLNYNIVSYPIRVMSGKWHLVLVWIENSEEPIKGWVYNKHLYNLNFDYAIILKKENGKWLIETFRFCPYCDWGPSENHRNELHR